MYNDYDFFMGLATAGPITLVASALLTAFIGWLVSKL